MKNNIIIILFGVLMLLNIIGMVYLSGKLAKYKTQIESVQYELENRKLERTILVEDIKKKAKLQMNLEANTNFMNKVLKLDHECNGNVLYLVLPQNVCLDCIKEHFNIIYGSIKQSKNLSLILLCNPIDYRKNKFYESFGINIKVVSIMEQMPIDSVKPFIFKLGKNQIEDLFFINKNCEDFTKACITVLSN